MPRRPSAEPTFRMRACRCFRSCGSSARASWIGAIRFVASTPSMRASSAPSSAPKYGVPAHWISVSTRRTPASATMSARPCAVVTSAASASTCPGIAPSPSPCASAASRSCERATSSTRAPLRTSAVAVAAPMPPLAPVSTTERSEMFTRSRPPREPATAAAGCGRCRRRVDRTCAPRARRRPGRMDRSGGRAARRDDGCAHGRARRASAGT